MIGIEQLTFDPTSAATIAATHSVGAYVRAGTDGDLIGSETLNSLEWLRVAGPIIDSAGNEVGVTSNALDVNIAAATGLAVFAEDSAHTSGDDGQHILAVRQDTLAASTSADGDYGSLKTTAAGALYVSADISNTEIAVTQGSDSPWAVEATDFDIRDLTHVSDSVQLGDGTDLITSTLEGGKQALDVYVANDIDVDDGIADTAISNAAESVGTTSGALVTSVLAARKYLYVQNNGGGGKIYIGGSGVSTANGIKMAVGALGEFRLGPSVAMHAVADSATADVRIMQMS